jgi:hypothetical protein
MRVHRPANISVAASRTTARRRIVELLEPAHLLLEASPKVSPGVSYQPRAARNPWRGSTTIVLADTDRAVKTAATGGLRTALPGPDAPKDHPEEDLAIT